MSAKSLIIRVVLILPVLFCGCAAVDSAKQEQWGVHDTSRPLPKIVTAGATSTEAPSDAIILFDGSDLSQWVRAGDGKEAKWLVRDGYMEARKGSGDIRTRGSFGDCQLHVEWACPQEVKGSGQGRGNSGVYLMDKYEVQVLDSFNNKTYADGQAAAIYGQKPPMVNACREPGKWQSYDIIFRRPIFKDDKLVNPATITVLHNGVLVQDHWVIKGTTRWQQRASYEPHGDKLPIRLQYHGNPVRYRNIWIRELPRRQ